ncbi:MAG: amidohydrolase family protein [Armatimonadota bacterium]
MSQAIIDMHQHPPTADGLDARVEACRGAGIVKAVLLGLPERRRPGCNADALAAARAYPELFIPFYAGNMDAMAPDDITRARDEGFAGLKFIAPGRQYNDRVYFPLYERAAGLRMPALFHLGTIANTPGWTDVDSSLMRPIYIDHVARNFPELPIIGAHFGNPWSDEAAMCCRWNLNLFFDLSGSLLKYRKPSYLGDLLWWTGTGHYAPRDGRGAWEKIVFGSDVDSPEIQDMVDDYTMLMDALALAPELREAIWYQTAARILGL